jgi:hypothetical protein
MWNQWENCFEGSPGAARASGQIHNQRQSPGTRKGAAQRGKLRLLSALSAHQFGKAIQQPVTDNPGSLRGNVTRSNTGTPGRHDKASDLALLAQCVFNVWLLVWNYQVADDLKSIRTQEIGNNRTRYIYPLPPKAGVAHGDDSGTHPTIVRADHESPIPRPLESMRE